MAPGGKALVMRYLWSRLIGQYNALYCTCTLKLPIQSTYEKYYEMADSFFFITKGLIDVLTMCFAKNATK
jgi:hypothetical protein